MANDPDRYARAALGRRKAAMARAGTVRWRALAEDLSPAEMQAREQLVLDQGGEATWQAQQHLERVVDATLARAGYPHQDERDDVAHDVGLGLYVLPREGGVFRRSGRGTFTTERVCGVVRQIPADPVLAALVGDGLWWEESVADFTDIAVLDAGSTVRSAELAAGLVSEFPTCA